MPGTRKTGAGPRILAPRFNIAAPPSSFPAAQCRREFCARLERWLAQSRQDQSRSRWKKLFHCNPLRALTGCAPKKQPAPRRWCSRECPTPRNAAGCRFYLAFKRGDRPHPPCFVQIHEAPRHGAKWRASPNSGCTADAEAKERRAPCIESAPATSMGAHLSCSRLTKTLRQVCSGENKLNIVRMQKICGRLRCRWRACRYESARNLHACAPFVPAVPAAMHGTP